MKILHAVLPIILLLPLCKVPAYGESPSANTLGRAIEWCDTALLSGLEGIWLLPRDRVYVALRRTTPGELAQYSVTVVASLDGVTMPGECLGTIDAAPDATRFYATLPTRKDKNGVPKGYRKLLMRLNSDKSTLLIEKGPKTVKLSFSPLSLLPGFWKMVRISITPQQREEIRGMVKLYPSPENGNALWPSPRYL